MANLCNLGNLSYILGRKLTWDGRQEQFVGDDEANRMLSRPQREPYQMYTHGDGNERTNVGRTSKLIVTQEVLQLVVESSPVAIDRDGGKPGTKTFDVAGLARTSDINSACACELQS